MDNVVKLDNKIRFRAIQYFSSTTPLVKLISEIKIAKPDDFKLLIALKRIREAAISEGRLIDEAMNDIRKEYLVDGKLPEQGTKEFIELDSRLMKYLNQTEIELPYDKIKLSEIKGIESLEMLDQLEGIIDQDI